MIAFVLLLIVCALLSINGTLKEIREYEQEISMPL